MKTPIRFIVSCCLFLFSASVMYAETFTIEDITGTEYYYVWEIDAAAEFDGDVHMAINRLDWLRYATNESGTWSVSGDITVVDASVSIALDAGGNAHICAHRWDGITDQVLVYATNVSGSWLVTEIPTAGKFYFYTAIALDSANNAYIVYCEKSTLDLSGITKLYYATNASGAWVGNNQIDSRTGTGHYCSVAMDSDDALHVSYCDTDGTRLRYATNATGSWIAENVNISPVDYIKDTDIAMDSSGKPHISYFEYEDDYSGQLRYAVKSSGTWYNYDVDTSGNAGAASTIAVTQDGKPRIAYFDLTNDKVKYARNTTGSWFTQEIADGENSGAVAIAMDPAYRMHICFDNQQLRHAHAGPLTPLPPENLNAALLPGQIHITWEDHSSNETGFLLQYAWTPTITPGWHTLADLGPNVTSYQMNAGVMNTTYYFRVCAYNTNGQSSWSNEDSVKILGLLSYIDIQSPNGGEDLPAGSLQTITWTNGMFPPSNVNLYYSTNGGSSWILIQAGVANTASYAWTVPSVSSSNCLVKVKSSTTSLYDISNAPFTISFRPELIVQSIQTVPEKPMFGQPFQVKVTVKNQGTVAAGPFWVSWYKNRSTPPPLGDDGELHEEVSSLSAGASHTMTKSITVWEPAIYSTWAQADSLGSVVEVDETNNILGPQSLDVMQFQITFNSGANTSWFGGDDRVGIKPRNIGYGQSITLNWLSQIRLVGFEFSGPFDYYDNPAGFGHEVTLVVNCRAPNGTLLSTSQEIVPASFAGGWIYFDFNQRLCPGQEFIFTCYLLNGETLELTNFMKSDSTAAFAEGRGYHGLTRVYGGDMENWSIWQLDPWDYHFKIGGFYPSHAGDVTYDGYVDIEDLVHFAQRWLQSPCYASEWCNYADIDCSGSVNITDFSKLSADWDI